MPSFSTAVRILNERPVAAFFTGHAICAALLYFPSYTTGPLPFPMADKLVHVILFAFLALMTRKFLGTGWKTFVFSGIVYGLLSEAIQGLFIYGRECSIWDAVADCIGCGAGLQLRWFLSVKA